MRLRFKQKMVVCFSEATDNTISVVIPLDANVMLGGDGDRLVKLQGAGRCG